MKREGALQSQARTEIELRGNCSVRRLETRSKEQGARSKKQGVRSKEYGVRNEKCGIITEEFSIKYLKKYFQNF